VYTANVISIILIELISRNL